MKRIQLIAGTLLLCFLAGCASAPAKYYSLDMRPSRPDATGPAIEVDHISIADTLASKNIYIQKSPTQIEYYAVDQWAADLGEILEDKLRVELERDSAQPTLVLQGTLERFGQQDTAWKKDTVSEAAAMVRLRVELRPKDASRYSEPLLKKAYVCEAPAAEPTAASVVEMLSRCVESIAAKIQSDAAELQE